MFLNPVWIGRVDSGTGDPEPNLIRGHLIGLECSHPDQDPVDLAEWAQKPVTQFNLGLSFFF